MSSSVFFQWFWKFFGRIQNLLSNTREDSVRARGEPWLALDQFPGRGEENELDEEGRDRLRRSMYRDIGRALRILADIHGEPCKK